MYPDAQWQQKSPEDAGFSSDKLNAIKEWLDSHDTEYRLAIVKSGYLITEWNQGHPSEYRARLASATKSIYSSILGIMIDEGKLPSADEKVIDYYPAAFDFAEDEGPKPGRYVFEKDKAITFRQLISNTSGYMKPDEEPGKVFHYQTYGMNILIHAMSQLFDLYDINDPEGSPGFRQLMEQYIAQPIGADWEYYYANFDLQPKAKINVFGYYDGVNSTALDMARLGWLWCNWGKWKDQQIIPEAWLREATQTAPDIKANCPEEDWQYGYGFWTNDNDKMTPGLPRKTFMAAGAGNHYIWVYPAEELVIVQSPNIWYRTDTEFTELLKRLLDCQN